MVKCPICGQQFDRDIEEFIKVGRRYYHTKCYEEHEKEQEKKKSSIDTIKKDLKTSEEQNRRELIGYVMELYNLSNINGLILKQIKEYKELGYSYIGMKSTLYYFHEILKNPVVATGIGIIPFVYDEAKQWYTSKAIAHKHFDDLIKDQGITNKKTVRIESKPLEVKKRQKIDIETL